MAEFAYSKVIVAWPPYYGGPSPYLLPKLHSLHLALTPRFFKFILPSLKSFSTTHITVPATFCATGTDAAFAYGVAPPPSAVIVGDESYRNYFDEEGSFPASELRKNNPNYKYFPKPDPHSTIFGRFPSTITHLSIQSESPLDLVLARFPNVTPHFGRIWDVWFSGCNF